MPLCPHLGWCITPEGESHQCNFNRILRETAANMLTLRSYATWIVETSSSSLRPLNSPSWSLLRHFCHSGFVYHLAGYYWLSPLVQKVYRVSADSCCFVAYIKPRHICKSYYKLYIYIYKYLYLYTYFCVTYKVHIISLRVYIYIRIHDFLVFGRPGWIVAISWWLVK